jgi:co-chaperonin GroES (HSP10)
MDPLTVRPLDKWVVIQPKTASRVVGLIHLPEYQVNAEKLSQGTGTILCKGRGLKNNSVKVEVGDQVAYREYLHILHPIDDSTAFLIHIDDVLGVISKGVEVGVFSRPAMHAVTEKQAKAMETK